MEESFARFKMKDEDEGGISYEEDTEELSEIDARWCLVGRFLTDSLIDFQAMQHRMAALWRPEMTAEGAGGIGATKRAVIIPVPVKVGNKMDMAVTSKKIRIDDIIAAGEISGDKNVIISNNILTRENENSNENNGLTVVDPKRRRLEEPIKVGLAESNNTEDTDMTEEDRLENLSSKNGLLAGCKADPPAIMKTLSWNCRGVGLPWNIQFLSDVVRQEKPMVIFLCEKLARKSKMEWVQMRLGFQGMFVVDCIGRSGGLALLWQENDQVEFTWERGRDTDDWMEVRLDRALTTEVWLNMFPMAKLYNVEGTTSDHSPILLVPQVISKVITPYRFKFENASMTEPMCEV
ncbi:hypothetical protein POM88_029998 [Heracleum sosnowskyi]|uniref:DUF4283 domain-containing protein n=1 Tax=Heracleum sosnowskyi TaxID=360622 RepID=A0AAD8HV61_9APIA|nr:hypothetical protein POM88_029998 [Heracleum sosnowskyi]